MNGLDIYLRAIRGDQSHRIDIIEAIFPIKVTAQLCTLEQKIVMFAQILGQMLRKSVTREMSERGVEWCWRLYLGLRVPSQAKFIC